MTVVNPGGSGTAFTQGTAAAKPATPAPNALYFATDSGEWWIGNAAGNAWQSIAATSATLFQAAFGASGMKLGLTSAKAGIVDSFGNSITQNSGWELNSGPLDITGTGFGLKVKEGSNCKQGVSAAMTTGSVTVANTAVTASSRIFVTRAPGGTNPGAVYVSTITAGTSFVITSTNAADTGTVFYEIFEPG